MSPAQTSFQTIFGDAIPVTALNQVTQSGSAYLCLIDDQSLVFATGPEADSFLHSQLSNDVLHLPEGQSRYAAYCTPKGRMLASVLYWKNASGLFLQCSASLQPAFQKRLHMFIMRAKAQLQEVSKDYLILGVGGQAVDALLQPYFAELPSQVNDLVHAEAGTLIRSRDAFGAARYQWLIPSDQVAALESLRDLKSTNGLTIVNSHIWQLADILAGVPQVIEQTKEKFVPQMINFELIGGVNFKKGCYPGQEIVARSQYLGKLKRRMAIALIENEDPRQVSAGMEIYSVSDPSQPCGMIVNSAAHFGSGVACLVEIKLLDQEQGLVHLGSATGPLLHFLPLPYAYLDVTE